MKARAFMCLAGSGAAAVNDRYFFGKRMWQGLVVLGLGIFKVQK